VAAAVLAVIALTAGCSNRQSPRSRGTGPSRPPVTAVKGADGVQTATVDSDDGFKFSPTEIVAAPGRLRIVLHNDGRTPHNLILPSLRAGTADASGGASAAVTVTVSAGTYDFLCDYHRDLGMVGHLVVR